MKQRLHRENPAPSGFKGHVIAASALTLLLLIHPLGAQTTAPASSAEPEGEVVELSPFTVEGTEDTGYMATSTLAGTRLRTNLADIGTAVSVLTTEFLSDIGATDNMSALTYATNTEVGGVAGNYQNAPNTGSWGQTDETGNMFAPNSNTRVRGLVGADNTRNYFRTTVAWDGYNVSRIDLLRGPNSILFGLGSPGGVVNASTESANLNKDGGEVSIVFDEFGSIRGVASYNKVLIKNELGVRVDLLTDNEKFQQDPAFDDENRIYLAAKYKPGFLNKNGTGFDVSVDYERGDGNSNRPRTAPPLDYLTAWVEPVSSRPIQLPAGTNFKDFPGGVIPAYTQFADQAGVSYLANIGRTRDPALTSWFDSFGPRLNVDSLDLGGDAWRQGRAWVEGVLLANGSVYRGNPQASRRLFGGGNGFEDTPLNAFNAYINNQGHPFGSSFIPLQITDPTVFDFHNKLLDGPNKEEWSDFEQFRVVLANTFMNQKFGYELSYFSELANRGQSTYLSNVARIFVDTQLENIEGQPNPDFGRPYVQESTAAGNRVSDTEIEGYRASVFFEHDFNEESKGESWLRSFLGRHVFNAAYSSDTTRNQSRTFSRLVIGPEFVEKSPSNPVFNNRTRVSLRYYVGDSLAGRSAVAGSSIGNLDKYVIPEGGPIDLRWFDTTWNADASVLPNAPWVNPLGATWEQAANPANYVGWSQGDYSIIDALSGSQADLDSATGSATLQENEVESKILTWQGFLFDGLLVGTYGWREDESSSALYRAGSNPAPFNNANLTDFSLDNPATVRDSLTVRSSNYSVVAHLNRLPWLGEKLPINASVSYNKGENFNPTSGRRDVNGNFLPAPQGSTEEYGLLVSTKDGKYTMRVLNFETGVLNSTSVQIPNANFLFNQFLALNPRDGVNNIEEGILRQDYEALAEPPAWSIDDQENIHAPAWRQFERDFQAAFPGFVDSWLNAGTYAPMDRDTNFSPAFVNTEDNVSKGWEVEFTANPTPSLRLTANISKTEAERTNVPGASTDAVYQFIQDAMFNADGSPTAAGAMRSSYDWQNDTIADFWFEGSWIPYGVVKQLNGQPAPELVEWRANVIANYSFTEGTLRGFGIGGALRYESGNAIGFPYYFDENGTNTADIARPFERDDNIRYDLWFSYRRPFFDGKIDWTIQLNIYNVLGDDELIPVRANPDGTMANFRIQQGQTWRLSNTFRF